MADVSGYEAPVITDVTEVDVPLIGGPVSSVPNPQWDEVTES